jgi:hypothetical protein
MMVNAYDDKNLLLVLQTDHSRIAGLLAAHWGNAHFAELSPYASMVLAAQEHDGGWWDWEIKPTLNDEGRPLDYIGSTRWLGPVWIDFYRNVINRVAARDLYAGYMVSMHGDALITQGMGLLPNLPDLSDKPNFREFVAEQKSFRDELRARLAADAAFRDATGDEQLWTNFKFMEVFDQLSQFVCNRYPLSSTARRQPSLTLSDVPVPTRPGQADTRLNLNVIDEATAVVEPYPFDVEQLPITFTGRLVPNRPFADETEFLRHFYKGDTVTVQYTLRAA